MRGRQWDEEASVHLQKRSKLEHVGHLSSKPICSTGFHKITGGIVNVEGSPSITSLELARNLPTEYLLYRKDSSVVFFIKVTQLTGNWTELIELQTATKYIIIKTRKPMFDTRTPWFSIYRRLQAPVTSISSSLQDISYMPERSKRSIDLNDLSI